VADRGASEPTDHGREPLSRRHRPSWETERLRTWRRYTDAPLTILAIGSLPILLLELEPDLVRVDRILVMVTNVVVLIAFAIDYVVELALARDRRRFVRSEWASLAIVVTQILAIVPSLGGFGVIRALRALRLLRPVVVLARLLIIGGLASRQARSFLRARTGRFAIGLAAFTWLTSAAAFTIAEDVGENGRLESFFDALWWSTATITTVGYGDVYPHTGIGRVIGGFTMLIGISSFAMVTARLAEVLVRPLPDDTDEDDAGERPA
jgi:voltage-gated potassium channel